MIPPRPKTDLLLEHMRAERWHAALAIAGTFRLLPEPTRVAIGRAKSALLSPATYVQMGQDPAELFEDAKRALRAHYGDRL